MDKKKVGLAILVGAILVALGWRARAVGPIQKKPGDTSSTSIHFEAKDSGDKIVNAGLMLYERGGTTPVRRYPVGYEMEQLSSTWKVYNVDIEFPWELNKPGLYDTQVYVESLWRRYNEVYEVK